MNPAHPSTASTSKDISARYSIERSGFNLWADVAGHMHGLTALLVECTKYKQYIAGPRVCGPNAHSTHP